MDYRRFNIAELSRETKTGRTTLHEWIRKGWLQHVQIIGSRKKYSIEAFLKAEKIAFDEASKNIAINFQENSKMNLNFSNNSGKSYNYKTTNNGIKVKTIPDEWFDNLEAIIEKQDQKKTLTVKSAKIPGKRITNNFSQK